MTEHDVPYLTTEQMVEVDRAMMEDLRIELIQMMGNAGRNLAHLARRRYRKPHSDGCLAGWNPVVEYRGVLGSPDPRVAAWRK